MANMKKLLQAAAGASSGAASGANVEDVFSTYLYEGNGAHTVITNGIDLGGPEDNVELHLQGDDSTTSADASTRSRTLTKTGTISTDTTTKKFTSSLDFNNSAYFVADAPLVNDTAPFCVETWIRWDDTQTSTNMSMICSQYTASQDGRMLFGAQSGNLVLRVNGGTVYLTTSVSTGVWYHIAWTWDGTTHRLFKDGTLADSSTTVPSLYLGTNTAIGGQATLSSYTLDGRIEDFRITQGKARYTENFTVPSANFDVDTTSDGGGMVWIKNRSSSNNHQLTCSDFDVEGGELLFPNTGGAIITRTDRFDYFNKNGLTVLGGTGTGTDGDEYVAWAFKKHSKFFDVVTYTGDGVGSRSISHNLGSVPGMIIVKRTDSSGDWSVAARLNDTQYTVGTSSSAQLQLNSTNSSTAAYTTATYMDESSFKANAFFQQSSTVNVSGATYVAYLFAHNDGDGDFGPDGDQDIIKCGSYTGTGFTNDLLETLDFEPQWMLVKRTDATSDWIIVDNMRGAVAGGDVYNLYPNGPDAEVEVGSVAPDAVGIRSGNTGAWGESNATDGTYIYMAIRRGPMAVPESADDVFAMGTRQADVPAYRSNFPVDFAFARATNIVNNWDTSARLMQAERIFTNLTNAAASNVAQYFDYQNGWNAGNGLDSNYQSWMWRRAPNFFDVVCYTGNGTAGRTVSHNLGVAPEMIWVKNRDQADNWVVYHSGMDATAPEEYAMFLNLTNDRSNQTGWWNDTAPTSSVFTVGDSSIGPNVSNEDFIAFLFASVDGVSKVGSVSHTTGSNTDVDCGFSAGARFVITKVADAATNWEVHDTARGIVAGNDARLGLNQTSAEDSSADRIDPYSSGFSIAADKDSGTYIYYAIA